jgi:ligand-binding SRPBCC domain-containing protein
MKKFTHLTRVSAPLEAVAAFHKDSQALRLLTPPPVFVQFHQVQPVKEGSVADFTLWFGPLPVRWVAIHSQVEKLHGFTDMQIRGPFDSWVHKHSFSVVEGGNTLITDEIQASLNKHPFWWVFGQLMWLTLPILFTYRGWAVRKFLKKKINRDPSSTHPFAAENRSN